MWDMIELVVMIQVPPSAYGCLAVRAPGKASLLNENLQAAWKRLQPDTPYGGVFQEDVFFWYFSSLSIQARVTAFTAVLYLLLTCMGLFGLVSFSVAKRVKEFSIRKVMGAHTVNLLISLNRSFIGLVFIGMIVAIPVSYWALEMLLGMVYKYNTGIRLQPFLLTGLTIVVTTALTIGTQVFKLSQLNPVENLKAE
jgi:hypothetical protein